MLVDTLLLLRPAILPLGSLLLLGLAPTFSQLLPLALSRTREYEADRKTKPQDSFERHRLFHPPQSL